MISIVKIHLKNLFAIIKKKKLLFILIFILVFEIIFTGFYYANLSPLSENRNIDEIKQAATEEAKKADEQAAAENQLKSQTAQNPNAQTPTSSNGGSTAPSVPSTPAPESITATVAFYADSQSDTDAEDLNHQRVVNYILGSSASTVFHAGDLLEDGTTDSLLRFNSVTSALRASKRFYSAQGNNERNSSVYFDNFSYPGNEYWFSVDIGNLHMVVLDNYASSVSVGSEQYNWLAADLASAASQSRITGVIFHYPIYGAGGDTKGMIGGMVPLFRNLGVDFVVSGHEHAYRRSLVDGIHYIICSGQPSIGYLKANIYSSRIDFFMYNSSNSQVDSVSFNNR